RAYAVADLLVARSGAATVSEASVAGVPALYVPLAIGNGEQRLNAAGSVRAGASLMVDNADFSRATGEETILPPMNDPARLEQMSRGTSAGTVPPRLTSRAGLEQMSRAALSLNSPTDAAERMAAIVTRALEG